MMDRTAHRHAQPAGSGWGAALRRMGFTAALGLAACGVPGAPSGSLHEVDLGCAHDAAPCSSCHPSDQPVMALDPGCVSCHLEDRPLEHASTLVDCAACHDPCAWDAVPRVHPDGFDAAAAHGVAANLQAGVTGDCRACHGADLTGATREDGWQVVGCDDCHAAEGHAGWRTDCTFCHGGAAGDLAGAPPEDLDGTSAADALSFQAHRAHGADGDHPAWSCSTCHDTPADVLSAGHAFDASPAAAEVDFTDGTSPAAHWDGTTCTDSYCHGDGRVNGDVPDDTTPLTCDGCHGTTEVTALSAVHGDHLLRDPTITCSDCHSVVVDPADVVFTPELHVDGAVEVTFGEGTMVHTPGQQDCTGTCHGVDHAAGGVGHPPGYDAREVHGRDANLQASDCAACHGADLTGGAVAPGCDSCHAAAGHADWRTDCTFCHGGTNGDTVGAPPQDLDDTSDVNAITFMAHRAHGAGGDHPDWSCDSCHTLPADVLSAGHAMDGTPGAAEVDFTGGTGPDTRWDGATCADSYCHGDGRTPGAVVDGTTPIGCDGCHGMADVAALSALHGDHLLADPSIRCSDCHADVIDATDVLSSPGLHVDGAVEVRFSEPSIVHTADRLDCTGSCHGVSHDQGVVGHPAGYAAADVHGLDANLQVTDCRACHGADLEGGPFARGCDSCHATEGHSGWRTDCTFCHGGTAGDTAGAPPQDLDNTSDVNAITFMAHRAHGTSGDHPAWGCNTCHALPSDVLSIGHAFDGTAGFAELSFLAGGGPTVRWDGTTCADSYCHGDGRTNGTVADGTASLGCDGCHATTASADLSEIHGRHMPSDPTITCADCHGGVVDAAQAILTPGLHVDGAVAVSFSTASLSHTVGQLDCSGTCHGVVHVDGTVGHPAGYAAADMHGVDANLQVDDCGACHGADLTGVGATPGCDSCHASAGHPDWRTDCTFCHGGTDGDTVGAPPEDIDNTTTPTALSFMAHRAHGTTGDHPVWSCSTCHDVPADVLSFGHAIDASPGLAEVDFTAGTSPAAIWNGTTCTGSYCHGDGRTAGSVSDGTTPLGCDGCHGTSDPLRLSGVHGQHISSDPTITCADCHAEVADAGDVIIGPSQHVDGRVSVDLAEPGMSTTPGQLDCTGTCHGVDHYAGVGGHPDGYDAPEVHGVDANLQVQDCRSCHGADLDGGPFAPGCDSCHGSVGHADWRTDCTFCHGGVAGDTTGAPPEDLDNTVSDAQLEFRAHAAHQDSSRHPDYACSQCHGGAADTYADAVTDLLHWFDSTAGRSEVLFTAGIARTTTWNGTSCATNYCHGNGLATATIADGHRAFDCNDCHADQASSGDAWDRMSGEHKKHLEAGFTCSECHASVTSAAEVLVGPAHHVDGVNDVVLGAGNGVTRNSAGRCSGTCHGSGHNHPTDSW